MYAIDRQEESGLQARLRIYLTDPCRQPCIMSAHEVCCIYTGILTLQSRESKVEINLKGIFRNVLEVIQVDL